VKTVIVIEIEHSKPIARLANLIAGRAWSIDGVEKAEVLPTNEESGRPHNLFSDAELMLGRYEVVRG
jgi:hypothetical protein